MHNDKFESLIENRLGYYGDIKAVFNAPWVKNVSINEIEDSGIYCVEVIAKWNSNVCYLLGNVENINFTEIVKYLSDHCKQIISYFPIDGLNCIGKKRIFVCVSKNQFNHKKTQCNNIRQLSLKEDINEILSILERDNNNSPCPDYEEFMRVNIKGLENVQNNQCDIDLWGYFANTELISLVRIDTVCKGDDHIIRNIGIFTKELYRKSGIAYSLISEVISNCKYENSIWRYEAEEENIVSVKLAQKLGFSYEGNTYCYMI